MTKYDLYWMSNPDWHGFTDDEEAKPFLTDKAPEEAKKSFAHYLEQKEASKRFEHYLEQREARRTGAT